MLNTRSLGPANPQAQSERSPMSNEERPIIIKKKKGGGGDGHHGGAWKVAYADFVTAMMAFFMLMWLLNATTEKQRKGLADYFNPSIPIARMSGGGQGLFNGDSLFSENTLTQTGTGGTTDGNANGQQAGQLDAKAVLDAAKRAAEDAVFQDLIEGLAGRGGDSLIQELAMRHIRTRVTDEGLVIELFATEGEPIFVEEQPTQLLLLLGQLIAEVSAVVANEIAVEGHTPSQPIVASANTTWEVSAARAQSMRRILEEAGLSTGRFQRVTGHADRDHGSRQPFDVGNNRVEVILLRSDT